MAHPTFAEKTKKKIEPLHSFKYPTEDQGIIFNHIDGTKIREYLLAIYELVGGPENIIAASRVSGGKVIIFLASKEIVEKFQTNYGRFHLGETLVITRKLKTPSVKIILSNVSPIVPNSAIEKELTNKLQLKLASPISILRISPTDDLFPHIICWRRQVYIHPNTNKNPIPNSFVINYGERSYRIFITQDDLTCFKCQSKGHKAENCTSAIDDEVEDSYNMHQPTQDQVKTIEQLNFPPLPQVPNIVEEPITPKDKFTQMQLKRGASTIASTTTQNSSNQLPNNNSDTAIQINEGKSKEEKSPKNRRKNKRQKTDKESNTNALILTENEKIQIRDTINSIRETKYTDLDFNADNFIHFLPATRNRQRRSDLIKTLTTNTEYLHYVLDEIKPVVTAGTKKTITALIKSISGSDSTAQTDVSDSESA